MGTGGQMLKEFFYKLLIMLIFLVASISPGLSALLIAKLFGELAGIVFATGIVIIICFLTI